jgi:gamma-glutamylcyclotransferase
VSFRYFAYGSNLWPPQLRSRCSSARAIGTATLPEWRLVCDKPSTDGSSKLNIRPDPTTSVQGVVYEIEDADREALDDAEPLYEAIEVTVSGSRAVTYAYRGEPHGEPPYDWYMETVVAGAEHHGLDVPRIGAVPDPLAAGIKPVGACGLAGMQGILSSGLSATTSRDFIHPGDLAWWIHHDDPRFPDHFSCWVQEEGGLLVVDSRPPFEINVFGLPGVARMPLVRWAQRRLGGRGVVGGISEEDLEMIADLQAGGYEPGHAFRSYEWDLTGELPRAESPPGWTLRHLEGESEADARRAASHAAFRSSMPPDMHLERYLGLMRSPVYDRERDLVAVSEDGRIGAFMIWWADEKSRIAQIEPFGTHPDFQRRGVGRALLYHGLGEMKRAGMKLARVCTEDDRAAATAFYESSGFVDVGRLRWWKPPRLD